MNIDLN